MRVYNNTLSKDKGKLSKKNLGIFAKTNPQLDFNSKPIPKLESNAKLT